MRGYSERESRVRIILNFERLWPYGEIILRGKFMVAVEVAFIFIMATKLSTSSLELETE